MLTTMIVYKLERQAQNEHYTEYDIVEYTVTMENETGSDWPLAEGGCIHTATLAVCTVLGIFVLFLGCTGNGVVLFNALTTKRLRSNFDLILINLAGADFITCTCLAPMFLFLLFSDSPVPEVFCGSVLFLGVTSCFLSLLSLVAISVHRYCRVTGRLNSPLSLRQTSSVVCIMWFISISMATGSTIHVATVWSGVAMNECNNIVNRSDSVTSNFMLFFMCPITVFSLVIIITCYGKIVSMVRYKAAPGHPAPQDRGDNYMDEINCECVNREDMAVVDIRSVTCRSGPGVAPGGGGCRAVSVCVVVILTVTVCWAPCVASTLLQLATGDSIILYQVKLCGIALIFLNSALDPYLYGQHGGNIKHKYAKLLYSVARCEYSVGNTSKIRKKDKRALEACPLKSSPPTQDTVSVPPDYPNNAKHTRRAARELSFHNANFVQNILMMDESNLLSNCVTKSKNVDGNHTVDMTT